jgi:hypothetical protein
MHCLEAWDMRISRTILCIAYGAIGLVALIGTWGNNAAYLDLGIVAANLHFWHETLVNPASRSITVDILLLSLAVIVWMLLEARRLSMKGVWLYVLAGLFIAISAAFPAFLIHRERILARREDSIQAGSLTPADLIGLAVLAVAMMSYTILSLSM